MKIEEVLLKKIKEYDVITIFGHIFPDGDCYGSQLGLKEILKLNFPNKKIYALGSGFKKMMNLIGYMDEVDDDTISSSLAIVLDTSTLDRVEDKRIALAKDMIHIDHHVKSTPFCEFSLVDEKSIATTEILTNLCIDWKLEINDKASTSLMLGLITDSGRFQYATSDRIFKVASILMEKGAKLGEIYDILYETNIQEIELRKLVFTSYKTGDGVIYTYFDNETIKKFNKTTNIASQTVNNLASIKGYPIWASFAEDDDGTVKAEFRCKKGYCVSSIAIAHGGGGHTCASGCSLANKNEVSNVIKELEDLVMEELYKKALQAMLEAGRLARIKILEIYNTDFDVITKEDLSPVTSADREADKIIYTYLKEKFPTFSFLTEESTDDLTRLNNEFVFIVDPVDGTKDFIVKNDEFTTNIALCRNHEIVVGVVLIPVTGEIYYAIKDKGSYYLKDDNSTPIRIQVSDKEKNLTLFLSRFHATDAEKELLKDFPQITKVEAHGSSIKACLIAHGKGEIHYRFSAGTKEWDTASIQLIVEEAGGLFIKPDGTRYTYNRVDVYNREGYIICNKKENILIKK